MDKRLDKIQGALIGLHAGDALGASVEFMMKESVLQKFPDGVREITGGGPFGFAKGAPTDDTDMTVCLLQAYETFPAGGKDLVREAADNFLGWADQGPIDIGNTVSAGLDKYSAIRDPYKSGMKGEHTQSNGSLMRTLPICLARKPGEILCQEAQEISAITHAHPNCQDACQVYCTMVSSLIDGASAPAAFEAGIAAAGTDEVKNIMHLVAEEVAAASELPKPQGGYVLHALAASVWALLSDKTLEEALVELVSLGDDADTIGAICGGLLGARDGLSSVPTRWREALQLETVLLAYGPKLLQIRDSKP